MAFRDFLKGVEIRRQPLESIRGWTERFDYILTRTGKRLHASCDEIPVSDFLHPLMVGMIYMDASGLEA
eukprot:12371445-Alexandrium_andersonii.AAC.1